NAISIALVLLSVACGSAGPARSASTASPTSIAKTPPAWAPYQTPPNAYASPASASRPAPEASPTPCPSPGPPAVFSPVSPSSKVLVLAKLSGSDSLVVRDVTDINHPSTVTTVDLLPNRATFVGPDQLSAPGAEGLDV